VVVIIRHPATAQDPATAARLIERLADGLLHQSARR
jgi:hypothetical protein